MKQKPIRRIGVFCVSIAVFVAALVSTGLLAAADTFTPSTVTVPSNVTLTVVKNFDSDLQSFGAGNAGDNQDGSVVEHCTTLGYGTSGGSIKWTYDKSKASWNAPSIRDSGETFYDMNGDGYFLWIKAEAAGTVRLEGLLTDWTTTVHCDADVKAGENLVYFPYTDFVKNDGSDFTMTALGCHVCLYAQTMPEAGTMYMDAFGTYEVDDSEPTSFVPSEKRVPEDVALTVIKNFDNGLQSFIAGNAGDNQDGSIAEHSTVWGYGTSGGSIKWTYDKSKASWNAPRIQDSTETFYDAKGDGYFLWIKSDAAGTARLQGQGKYGGDWVEIYCDAAIEAGENLVYFPYTSFVKNSDKTQAGSFSALGYKICLYLNDTPNAGTAYVDAFGTYEEGVTPPPTSDTSDSSSSASEQPKEHNPNYHKLIDDFSSYADDNSLIGVWSARNAGESGEGAIVTLDTTGENSVSGNSLKIVYDVGKASWYAPGVLKMKPDNQDFEGDGFCFWLKTEKAMSMRVSYLTEDAEAVFDIKDIPAGYEGYYHVPFSEVKYLQAGIETEYEDLGFEPMDFYYFSFYVYGLNMYDTYQNTVWFDDLSFYAEKSFDPTNSDVSNPPESTGANTSGGDVIDPVPTGVGLPLASGALAVLSAGVVLTAVKRRNRR